MTTSRGTYDYCFIIAYGRSGSTLLQGVLNAIDGYLIRGENGGILNQMWAMALTAERAKENFGALATEPSMPWYGIDLVERGPLLRDMRELFVRNFIRPGPGHRCLGCKEIRYGPINVTDLPGFIDFIDETFPKACFLFNSRKLDDTAASGWWKRRGESAEYLGMFEAEMRKVHARGRGNTFWVRYDDYVADPGSLEPLFDFLGEPFRRETVDSVLRIPHGVEIA